MVTMVSISTPEDGGLRDTRLLNVSAASRLQRAPAPLTTAPVRVTAAAPVRAAAAPVRDTAAPVRVTAAPAVFHVLALIVKLSSALLHKYYALQLPKLASFAKKYDLNKARTSVST